MTQKSTPPLPTQGGSYIRAKDGSLIRTETEAAPEPQVADDAGKTTKEG